MKRHLLSTALALGAAALLGLAAGHARADGPSTALPKGPPAPGAPAVTDAPPPPGAAAPAAPAVVAPPPVTGCTPVPAACCPAPACEAPALKKVCVGETATREKTSRVYGETCEDFCIPKCSLFGGFSLGGHKHDDCGACPDNACADGACTSCEHHARERKYLVVRIKKEEECYNKCHVEYQVEEPKCKESLFHHTKACADGGCLPPAGGCAGVVAPPPAAPMPPVEKLQPLKEFQPPKDK